MGIPILWASFITLTHSAVETLLGHILALTESTRISADAPVIVSNPDSFKAFNDSLIVNSDVFAAWKTSTGDNPWMSIL